MSASCIILNTFTLSALATVLFSAVRTAMYCTKLQFTKHIHTHVWYTFKLVFALQKLNKPYCCMFLHIEPNVRYYYG